MNMEYDGDCVPIVLDREPSLKGEKKYKKYSFKQFWSYTGLLQNQHPSEGS